MSDFSWNAGQSERRLYQHREMNDIALNTQALLQLKQWQNPDLLLKFARTTYTEARKVLPNQSTSSDLEQFRTLIEEIETEIRKIVVENHSGLVNQTSALHRLGDCFAQAANQARELSDSASFVRQTIGPKLQLLEKLTNRYIRAVKTQGTLRACRELTDLTHGLRTMWASIETGFVAEAEAERDKANRDNLEGKKPSDGSNVATVSVLSPRILEAAALASRVEMRSRQLGSLIERLPILKDEVNDVNKIIGEIESRTKRIALVALADASNPTASSEIQGQSLQTVASSIRILLALPSGLHRVCVLVGEALSRLCKNNRAACRRAFDMTTLSKELDSAMNDTQTERETTNQNLSSIGNPQGYLIDRLMATRFMALMNAALRHTSQIWLLELALSQLPRSKEFQEGSSFSESTPSSLLQMVLPRIQIPALSTSPDSPGVPSLTWAAWITFLKDFSSEITKVMSATPATSKDTLASALAATDSVPTRIRTLVRMSLITEFVGYAFILIDTQVRLASAILHSSRSLALANKSTSFSSAKLASYSLQNSLLLDEEASAYEFASQVFNSVGFTFPDPGASLGLTAASQESTIPAALSNIWEILQAENTRSSVPIEQDTSGPSTKKRRLEPLAPSNIARKISNINIASQNQGLSFESLNFAKYLEERSSHGTEDQEETEASKESKSDELSYLIESTSLPALGPKAKALTMSLARVLDLVANVMFCAGSAPTSNTVRSESPGPLLSHPRELYLLTKLNEARAKASQISSPSKISLPSAMDVSGYLRVALTLLNTADALSCSRGVVESINSIIDTEICSISSSLRSLVVLPSEIVTYSKAGHELLYESVPDDPEMLGELTPQLVAFQVSQPNRSAEKSVEEGSTQASVVLESDCSMLSQTFSLNAISNAAASLLKTGTPEPVAASSGDSLEQLQSTVDKLLSQVSHFGISKIQVDNATVYHLVVLLLKVLDADSLSKQYPYLKACLNSMMKASKQVKGTSSPLLLLGKSYQSLMTLAKEIYMSALQSYLAHSLSAIRLMHQQGYCDQTCETSECPIDYVPIGKSRGKVQPPLAQFPTAYYLSLLAAQCRVFVARVLPLYRATIAPTTLRLFVFSQLCQTTAELARGFVRSASLVCPIQERGKLRLVSELANFDTNVLELLVPRAKLAAMTQISEMRAHSLKDHSTSGAGASRYEAESAIVNASEAATDANYPMIISHFREILCSPPEALQEAARVVRDHLKTTVMSTQADALEGQNNSHNDTIIRDNNSMDSFGETERKLKAGGRENPSSSWMSTVMPIDLVHILMCHSDAQQRDNLSPNSMSSASSSPASLAKMPVADYIRHVHVRRRSQDLLFVQIRKLWSKLIKTLYLTHLRIQQQQQQTEDSDPMVDTASLMTNIDEEALYAWLGQAHPTLVTAGGLLTECLDLYKARRSKSNLKSE